MHGKLLIPILAKIELPVPDASPSRLGHLVFTDILLIIAVGVVLMTGLLAWAIFVRKPQAPGSSRRIYKSESEPSSEDGSTRERSSRRRKRHRKRRRPHRGRNPTLSETGGLPPPRTGPDATF